MLAWLKSPQGSAATVVAVAAVLGILEFAPRPAGMSGSGPPPVSGSGSPVSEQATPIFPKPTAPATAPSSAPPSRQASLTASPVRPPPVATPPGISDGASAKAGDTVPSFDVVRVERTGEAVVAGRAAPDTEVELIDGGTVVAHVRTDASGQFALLPPALGEGDHYLTLQATRAGGARVASVQSVAVAMTKGGGAKPMVALLSPDQPAKVLSDGAPVQPVGAGAAPSDRTLAVAIQSVEAGAGGQLTASGVAEAGHQCRLYLNGAFLADVTAGQDGRWSVKVSKGMKPGKYTVRADELAKLDGAVTHRAEVPFTYPVTASVGSARRLLLAKAGAGVAVKAGQGATPPVATRARTTPAMASAPPHLGSSAMPGEPVREASAAASNSDASPSHDPSSVRGSSAVVNQLQTATVTRGDSLWRISRKMLGHGVNYTEIYASNTAQIRDPKLIYPGQVFVVPNRAVD